MGIRFSQRQCEERVLEKQQRITKSGARAVALTILLRCEKQAAWLDGALKSELRINKLSQKDAALCSKLCYGVCQNRMLLDFWLNYFSKVKSEKLEPAVRQSILMAMYQIAMLDKIPQRAAVNEAVELARANSKNPRSPALVNGILRAFCRQAEQLPQPEAYSIRYSHPQWLVDLLDEALCHEGVEALLACNNSEPPTTIQTNDLQSSAPDLRRELEQQGVQVEPHPWLEGCFYLRKTGDLEQMEAFRTGKFLVQDAASRLAVLAADPRPGMQVLDACAAPGGKSFRAGIQMKDQGTILSCDIHAGKIKEIKKGARRLGLHGIQAMTANAKENHADWQGRFDLVLCDVPCSGLGIIRKKPDIRWKEPEPLKGLPMVQRAILNNQSHYVKPGGVLFYSTCTVLKRENEEVVQQFLHTHPEFQLEKFVLPGSIGLVPKGYITLWSHIHGTDGFFMAKMRKQHD